MTSDRRRIALVLLGGACSPDIQDDLVFDPSTTSTTDPVTDPTTSTGPVDPTTSTGEVADTSSSSTTAPVESSSSEGPAEESSSTTDPGPSVCGNGVHEEGESCDDMNDDNIDGCSNDCGAPGNAIWNAYYAGALAVDDTAHGVAVDGAGNIVIVGTTGPDVRIAKYDPSGVQTWQVVYDAGLFLADYAYDVAIDSNDDVVIAGSIFVDNYDMWLAKYSDDGVLQWSEWHTGPVSSTDRGFALRIDDADDIYVGGFEFVSQQGRNVWLGKYTPGGNFIWAATFDGLASNGDELGSIDFDADGNIVGAGTTDVDGEDDNILVGKWDPDGNEIWVVDHDGPQGTNDNGLGIGATPDGGMIVVGATQVLVDVQGGVIWDMWMGKFDSDGVLEWEDTYDGPLMGEDIAEEVEVDSQGNFIVVGTLAVDEDVPGTVYNGQPPQRRGWIRKYDPDAEEIWTYDYGPQNRWTWAFDVSLEADDDIFVAGQNTQMDGQADPDMFLLKLAP